MTACSKLVADRVQEKCLELLLGLLFLQLVSLPPPFLLLRRATQLNLSLPLLETGQDPFLPGLLRPGLCLLQPRQNHGSVISTRHSPSLPHSPEGSL